MPSMKGTFQKRQKQMGTEGKTEDLRKDCKRPIHFWLFDGWEIPEGKSVVAEVYPARCQAVPWSACLRQVTASACLRWPFCPSTMSNSTSSPSLSVLYPSIWIAEWWTNTSGPFSRPMNPKPLALLNHLTFPLYCATSSCLPCPEFLHRGFSISITTLLNGLLHRVPWYPAIDTGFLLGEMIVENHISQRLMDSDATVVFNKAELAKAIHEEADAGAGGADHLCQSFLRYGRNENFRFTGFVEFRHQQENPRQTLFAVVEKLIDKVGLGSHTPCQQEFHIHF